MSRIPIKPGDHVLCGMIGTTSSDEPFPYWFEGWVIGIHDSFIRVLDFESHCISEVPRERIITDDQVRAIKERLEE